MSEVIYYSSDEAGAPSLNNAAGSLVAVLDACLINGFNQKNVTALSVSSGVATATISAHGYLTNRKVVIAGAATTAINGLKKVTVVDANTISFDATGVADGVISGTITAKRAPLGWSKAFSGTNQAMYQRTDPAATGSLLRIDDSAGGVHANAIMVETATGINTYTNNTNNYTWAKGANSASPQNWILVGDSTAFHLFCDSTTSAGANGMRAYTFGDLVSYRAGDAYCSIIGGSDADDTLLLWFRTADWRVPSNALFVQRPASQFGGFQTVSVIGAPTDGTFTPFGGGTSGPTYPSSVDGGLIFQGNTIVYDGVSIRGYVKGLKEPLAIVPSFMHKAEMTGIHGTTSTYLIVMIKGANSTQGAVAIDITGPWI